MNDALLALDQATRRCRRVLRTLIEDACPYNWGDDDASAKAWLAASKLVNVPLPDPDHSHNADARARLSPSVQKWLEDEGPSHAPFAFPADLLERLRPHAEARGVHANELARRIVDTVVDEGMIDAVLDDGADAAQGQVQNM